MKDDSLFFPGGSLINCRYPDIDELTRNDVPVTILCIRIYFTFKVPGVDPYITVKWEFPTLKSKIGNELLKAFVVLVRIQTV